MEITVMDSNKQNALEQYEDLLNGGGAAYERIASLFDAGTFVELGRFVKKSTTSFDSEPGNEFEGVVTGYGAIDGKLVFSFVQDSSRMKGAMSEAHAKKIVSLYEAAIRSGAPVIGVFDSAGAKVLEGVSALSGYGSIMKSCAAASGVIPQIAVIAGVCSGSLAAIAEMADIVIASEDEGKLYTCAPNALEARGFKSAGSVKAAAENGGVAIRVKTTGEALACAKKLISLFPSNNSEGSAYTQNGDDANRTVSGSGSAVEDAKEIADSGSLTELFADFGSDVKTYICSIAGITSGIVASADLLSAKGADKTAKFVSLCDSFNIPVVTLVDCAGTVISPESENAPFSAKIARLAHVYGASSTAKVTVITGKAYGCIFTVLGSKTLGADIVYALPDAQISIMPSEAAIEFIYGDQIRAAADPTSEKEEAKKEWAKLCTAVNAARNGDIDDVIAPEELRKRIAASLEMLSGKAAGAPFKKHGNLPL